MPPETLRAIFEPFHQVGRVQHRGGGGVGLGLFIVRRMLEMLGGKICIDSRPGCGSTFRVWLPNMPLPAAEAAVADSPPPGQAGPSLCAAGV
jgi:signal transduction histidine kinase